jgi:WD40 repeat protein
VSCLQYLQEGPNAFIAAGGWHNEVKMWVDGDDTDKPHHKMVGHHDDILSMEFCAPSLATGSYDGSVILWKVPIPTTPRGFGFPAAPAERGEPNPLTLILTLHAGKGQP